MNETPINAIGRANQAIRELNRNIKMIEVGDSVRFHLTENRYFTQVGMVNEAYWKNGSRHFVVWTLATKYEDNRRYEVPAEWITEVIDLVDNDPLP
ncbi:MAG TPA: hypothetical protein EYQ21_00150 [Flavobacteriales bacterium]|nr:hypothetical protein [Flavobacteriales bacterium]